ncbi:MAG TPA: GntR family transcriptional regulator [Solirubrobacteraceae bacterium]|nr:GntR family transcriptional regulator [Solirubrobacteraceae bacterium]
MPPEPDSLSLGASTKIEQEPTYANRIADMILTAIGTGQLEPGTLYSVRALAEALGVSRTPVREALLSLARQGMVRFERNRGVRIIEASTHELEELFVLRLSLEVPATYRATPRLSPDGLNAIRLNLADMHAAESHDDEPLLMHHDRLFHKNILEASGNSRLAAIVDQLRDAVLTRGASTVGRSRALRDILLEHATILTCLEQRDGAGAAVAMHDHIQTTGQLILLQEGGNAAALDSVYALEAWRAVHDRPSRELSE